MTTEISLSAPRIVLGWQTLFAIPRPADYVEASEGVAIDGFQTSHADPQALLEALKPGPAFPLVRGLFDLRRQIPDIGAHIRLLSRMSYDKAEPYYKAAERYGLASGSADGFDGSSLVDDPTSSARNFEEILARLASFNASSPIDAFITVNRRLALRTQAIGIPTIHFERMTTDSQDQLFFKRWTLENLADKIVPFDVTVDLDSTALDSVSDWFFELAILGFKDMTADKMKNIQTAVDLFLEHELQRMDEPMKPGGLFPLLEGLRGLRAKEALQFGERAPRDSLVHYDALTTRANISLRRALNTLKNFGYTGQFAFNEVDGMRNWRSKGEILRVTQPLVHFDDTKKHRDAARALGIPAGAILRGPQNPDCLAIPEERNAVNTAMQRLFEMADAAGLPLNKEAVAKYVEGILAMHGGA